MKRISYFLFLTFLVSLISTSCSNTKTYAQQLDDEKALITAYIKRNNINVLSSLPKAKWGPNDYYLSPSGLYFHLVDSGNTSLPLADTLTINNMIIPRYKQYALTVNPDTTSNWDTLNYPFPTSFVNGGDLTNTAPAFQEAARLMRIIDAEAIIIVPYSLGFAADKTSITPYAYTITIKFRKQ